MYECKFAQQRTVLPEIYPFTQWHAYGSPAYGIVPTDPLVEFVDQETGRRTVIIDEKRRIVNFPGIEKEDEIKELLGEESTIPFNLFGASFAVAEKGCYEMIWTIQLDGRFWEDEDGFGGTSLTMKYASAQSLINTVNLLPLFACISHRWAKFLPVEFV